jgi:hypothetical protein
MAGAITISTLNNDTGVLATQNGMTGIAKAWVNYNSVAQTVTGSFNVSSVTYNAAGQQTMNFTTAMSNANYAVAGIATKNDNSGGYMIVTRRLSDTYTTTAVTWRTSYDNTVENVSPSTSIIVLGT